MPWVRFVRDFTYVPSLRRSVSIAYKPGMVLFVKRECAEQAILLGRAVHCDKEGRESQGAPADEHKG